MSQPIVIAHVSDLHLGPLPRLPLTYVNLKRVLGTLNWHRKRKVLHRIEAWEIVRRDLAALRPDHLIVSGDIINIGLPTEHEQAARLLATFGEPSDVSVVPGNHDIYSWIGSDPGVERWRPWMTSLPPDSEFATASSRSTHPSSHPPAGFPFVRRVGDVAIIGLDSAEPTPPFSARGRLGARQLERLAQVLTRLGELRLFRLVVVHHPPLPGQSPPSRALIDAPQLVSVLAACGAELIVHGHNHRDEEHRLATRSGLAAVVGVGSASAVRPHGREPAARLAIYRITRIAVGFALELERRGLATGGHRLIEIERRALPGGEATAGYRPHEKN